MFAHESERTRSVVSLLNPITRTIIIVAYVLERMFTVHTKRWRVLLSKRPMRTSGFLKVTGSYVHRESGSFSETVQDTETMLIQTTNRKRYMTAKAVMPNTSITYKTNRTGTITEPRGQRGMTNKTDILPSRKTKTDWMLCLIQTTNKSNQR